MKYPSATNRRFLQQNAVRVNNADRQNQKMWRRKTDAEKESEARILDTQRKNLALPAIFALCIALVISSSAALGSGKYGRPRDPMSFSDAARYIPISSVLWFPFTFAILVYSRRKGYWESSSSSAYICTECQNIQAKDTAGCTMCHHTIEPLKDWRWIDHLKQ